MLARAQTRAESSTALAADTLTQSKSNPSTPMEPQVSSIGPNPNVVTFSLEELGVPTETVVAAGGKLSQRS